MITSIKEFKYLNERVFTKVEIKDIIKGMLHDDYDVKEEEFVINHVYDFINRIDKLPQVFNAYRVLHLDDIKKINTKMLGRHYIIDLSIINKEWIKTIVHEVHEKLFLITTSINKDNINYYRTIAQNAQWYTEYEVYINNDYDMPILNIEELSI